MSLHIEANTPAMLGDLKVANRRTVLSAFRRGAVAGVSEVSQQTGISRPTVVKCIRFFLDSGLLVSLGKGPSTAIGGKRPENYTLSGRRYFLCLALWPQEMRACLYTIGHTLLGSISLSGPLPDTADEISRKSATLAARLLREQCVQPRDVCAVSVSTSGTVDRETGTLLYSSHTPQWGTHVHLLADLRGLFGLATPISLENAGKMCARPFLLDSALRSQRVLVLFTTWGLSGCMLEHGHILSGQNSLIGEVGHMTLDPSDPEPCGCGSHGCFERLVSAARVRRMVRTYHRHLPESSGDGSGGIQCIADLTVDLTQHVATRSGKRLLLSAKESAILEYFAQHAGKILTREEIEAHIAVQDSGSGLVPVYIHYLRQKIDEGYPLPLLHTVRGKGYMLSANPMRKPRRCFRPVACAV